jgi:hypothetical protein
MLILVFEVKMKKEITKLLEAIDNGDFSDCIDFDYDVVESLSKESNRCYLSLDTKAEINKAKKNWNVSKFPIILKETDGIITDICPIDDITSGDWEDVSD